MADSIFTKIEKGEVPGEVLYRDELCFAILDIAPHRPGHMLVIPREQALRVYDLPLEHYNHLMDVVRWFATILEHEFTPKAVSIIMAGLQLDHAHVHLIPVEEESDVDSGKGVMIEKSELALIAAKLRGAIAQSPFETVQ